jgi:threonine dehydratase
MGRVRDAWQTAGRYDVGEHNWPILKEHVTKAVVVADVETQQAMRWLYQHHGLMVEPSGAAALAAALTNACNLADSDGGGGGDVVIVVSGRNVDEPAFVRWVAETGHWSDGCPFTAAQHAL